MAKKKSALGLDKLETETQHHDATESQKHDATEPRKHGAVTSRDRGNMESQFQDLIPVRSKQPAASTLTSGGLMRKPIYFDVELWEAIGQLAMEKGVSASGLIRFGMRHFLGMNVGEAHKPPGPKR